MNFESGEFLVMVGGFSLAIVSVVIGLVRLNIERSRKSWLSVQSIIRKRVENNQSVALGTGKYLCKFFLEYEYEVEGNVYIGDGYCSPHDYATNDQEMFQMIEGKFKVGNKIDVFIDPKHPEKSMIFIEGSSYHMAFFAVAVMGVILVISSLIL